PAVQLVFIRAVIGLLVIAPLLWQRHAELRAIRAPWRHAFRVLCSVCALNANFYAITVLPLALVNAIGYMRPIITMLLAIALLGDRISALRWISAAVVLLGVAIAVLPAVSGLTGVAMPLG